MKSDRGYSKRGMLLYRAELIIVAFYLIVIVLAGSHGGISLRNLETLFFISTSLIFTVTFFSLTLFLNLRLQKVKEWFRILSIGLTYAVLVLIIFMIYKLVVFDFDRSSVLPYLGFILLGLMLIQTYLLLKSGFKS